jgi:hypothetical protein
MITLLLAVLILAALPTAGLGLLVIWHIARPQRAGADASNRLNKARLLWFALTREELFVPLFPWLARDEHANVTPEP